MEQWTEGVEVERHLGSTFYRLPHRGALFVRLSGVLALLLSFGLTVGMTLLVHSQLRELKEPTTALLAISVMALIYFGMIGGAFRWSSLLLLTRTEIELRPRYIRVTERFLFPIWRKTLLLKQPDTVSIVRLFNNRQYAQYSTNEENNLQESSPPSASQLSILALGRHALDWEAVMFAHGHTFALLKRVAEDMASELQKWQAQSLDQKVGGFLKPPPDSLVTFRVEGKSWSTLFPQGGWSQRNINLVVGGAVILLITLLSMLWILLTQPSWTMLWLTPIGYLLGGGSLFAGWVGVSTQTMFEWNPDVGLSIKGRNLVRKYKSTVPLENITRLTLEESPIRTSEEAALQLRLFQADGEFEAYLDNREREEVLWFGQILSQTTGIPLELEYEDEPPPEIQGSPPLPPP